MRSEDEIKRDCTKCIYFDIETCYGVCDKHGIILNYESLCEDYEEDNQCAKVIQKNKLKNYNRRITNERNRKDV